STAWRVPSVDSWRLVRRFGGALAASSIFLLMPVILRALVSFGGEGSASAFNFATKLVELPTGIVIVTIATTTLPVLSQHLNRGEVADAQRAFAIRFTLATLGGVAIGFPAFWFAEPIAG